VRLGVFFAENPQNQPGDKVLIALSICDIPFWYVMTEFNLISTGIFHLSTTEKN